jgi:hypothetical protein
LFLELSLMELFFMGQFSQHQIEVIVFAPFHEPFAHAAHRISPR